MTGRRPRELARARVALVLPLVAAYMVAEVVGGWLTNSLALLADAGHMLSDVAALGLTLFAMWIARRPASTTRTFGYYRAEILAALANGATLIAVAVYVFVEAWRRLREPPVVLGGPMLAVAVGGLAVNVVALWLLRGSRSESLNVRGAWLHVLGDALGSVGAIGSGALISAFGWNWVDPVASVAIGLLILHSSSSRRRSRCSWRAFQATWISMRFVVRSAASRGWRRSTISTFGPSRVAW